MVTFSVTGDAFSGGIVLKHQSGVGRIAGGIGK
jgi:hypothetical protein